MRFTQCSGNGLSSCYLCNLRGLCSYTWDCFFYFIDGFGDLRFCYSCVCEILSEVDDNDLC